MGSTDSSRIKGVALWSNMGLLARARRAKRCVSEDEDGAPGEENGLVYPVVWSINSRRAWPCEAEGSARSESWEMGTALYAIAL